MRYQWLVTDFAHTALTELAPAEARLAAVLARPRPIALACIVVLTLAGWGALGLMGSDTLAVLCQPVAANGLSAGLLAVPMWIAMVLAMMLPTAGPMILTYAEIADTAQRKGERVVSPLMLTAGYLMVWLGFALLAAMLQALLARADLIEDGRLAPLLAAAMFTGAGLYQFSALKQACLTKCQRPFPFLFAHWTTERRGVLRLGWRQGMICLGCCWAMMLIMLAAGAMNAVWMAGLGLVMIVEKLTAMASFSRAAGVASIMIGLGLAAASWMA
jgi:predicted metal-binding membrane protein